MLKKKVKMDRKVKAVMSRVDGSAGPAGGIGNDVGGEFWNSTIQAIAGQTWFSSTAVPRAVRREN
ncbi:MAG: hypothetical protein IIU15_04255 [Treponema sp.]|nr:hypothetical protein [Treponema sp.]